MEIYLNLLNHLHIQWNLVPVITKLWKYSSCEVFYLFGSSFHTTVSFQQAAFWSVTYLSRNISFVYNKTDLLQRGCIATLKYMAQSK